ncbi:MAG: TonB-dependent receptor, partial [Bacteroidota bacterium]
MKQLLFLFALLFVLSSTLLAQQADSCKYELRGVVLDAETKETLPYAQIVVKGTQKFALTDVDGNFQLQQLCPSSSQVVISNLGYADTTYRVSYPSNDQVTIYLEKQISALDAVTVTAARSKAEGTVSIAQESINKSVLSANPTQSLAAALSSITGVTFTSAGNNVQLPVIHGLYGNRVLILNNGVKHGFQNWGSDQAPEIDIAAANRVTVLKGAAGVRYGPEALGGAIVVNGDPLHFERPFKSKVGTGYQTNGNGYFANFELGKGWDNWSYHLGGSYTRRGDQRSPDYSLTNTGKEEQSIHGGLRYRLSNQLSFKVYYSYLRQNLGLLRSSIANSGAAFVQAVNAAQPAIINDFSFDINQPSQLVQHHLGKVEANWRYADDAKLTLRIGSQLNQRDEFDVRRNANLPIIDLDLLTNDFQLEWEHPEWLRLNGLVGVQFFTQNNDNNPGTQTTPFIPNYNTARVSAFAVESFQFNASTFELGIRLDHEYNNVRGRETNQDVFRDEYNFTNVTASLGYIVNLTDRQTFRTNLATAWRTPNMAELYSFGQHGFKSTFGLLRYYTDANEGGAFRTDRVIELDESNIEAEQGYKWINEWRTQRRKSAFTLTAYTHYIRNYIFDRPLAVVGTIRGPMPVFIYDQVDALFIGADVSWQQDWSETLKGTLGMSYLFAENL